MQTFIHQPQQANLELQQLHRIMKYIQMNTQGKDVWSYIWGTNNYASKKYYSLYFKSIEVPKPFQWIWKSKVTKKLKIFIWLVFRDRINSRNILKRKNYSIEGDDYNCVLCNLNIEEYTYHLIFQCPFSAWCWNYLGIHWDHNLYFFDTIQKTRNDNRLEFFMEVFLAVAWEILPTLWSKFCIDYREILDFLSWINSLS
jgi:hypothetical protein